MRQLTSFLCGTSLAEGVGRTVLSVLGLLYVLLYLSSVVVAPILLLATLPLCFMEKRRPS